MASSYPGAIDTFTDPSGTSLLATGPDHAADHTLIHSSTKALENTLGTTLGTALFGAYAVADKPLRHQGGTVQQVMFGTLNNGVLGTPTITGGQMAGSANLAAGTLTSPQINGTITSNGTINGLTFGVTIAPGAGTIVDSAGGTQIVNAQAANIYYSAQGTSAGNRTIGTPTNPQPYQQLTYAFKTSGSANGTLVWASVFRISQDYGTPTLGTGVSWNYYSWRYSGIDSKWDFQGQVKDLV